MRILLIDDGKLDRKAICDFLSVHLDHEVVRCGNSTEALKIYRKKHFPVVITDLRMPGLSGIDILSYIKKMPEGKCTDVVLITDYENTKSAIRSLRQKGAYDYLVKPINIEELASVIERVEEHITLIRENRKYKSRFENEVTGGSANIRKRYTGLREDYSKAVVTDGIGIFSKKMEKIRQLALKLHFDRTIPVLLEGETGTGKDVVARLIHCGQKEVAKPFISINCTTIPANLFETEIFGYEEGAFTDARKKGSIGKFELAQGGTIFLDEIGELPLDIQPKLLRVLEERAFYRVGGIKKIKLDIRVIGATNQDLNRKVKERKFRQDLFYRLNVARVYVPPLRERREEIQPMAQMFLQRISGEKNKMFKSFHERSIDILENYKWPGNIRELHNTIERVILMHNDIEVQPEYIHLLTEEQDNFPLANISLEIGQIRLPPNRLNLKELEKIIVKRALDKFNGNKTKTAAYLGLTRSALRSKISPITRSSVKESKKT
jgi:DNA-binding NtrC family response regulator